MARVARYAARLLRAAPLAELPALRSAAAWARGPAAWGEARPLPAAAAPWQGAAPRGFAAAAGGDGDGDDSEDEDEEDEEEDEEDEEEEEAPASRAEERRLRAQARAEKLMEELDSSAVPRARAKRGGGAGRGDEEEDDDGAGLPRRSLLQRLEGMSRKQQQFALAQELMGRGEVSREVAAKVFMRAQAVAAEAPDSFESLTDTLQEWEHAASQEEKADPLQPFERSLEMHVVNINRTVKVTKSGSLQRFTALVVVGNGAGAVGWALGKAPEVPAAVDKAYARAARSLFYFPRYQEHTIFHSAHAKFGATHVSIDPLPSGMGLKANDTIQAVCRLAGIRDMRAKVIGSHNPHTTLRATFEALDSVRTPAEVAAARGRAVLETMPRRRSRQQPRASS